MKSPRSSNSRGGADQAHQDRLLIVDDDAMVCQLLESLGVRWGMHPVSVTEPTLEEGWIRERAPDVCLLDLQLGRLSGLDLIPVIRSVDPDCRIIIVTGYAEKETAIGALRLGAFDIIEKPFDTGLLEHAVRRALESREKDRSLRKLVEDLRQSEGELLRQRVELERLNERLIETHEAFLSLARSVEMERRDAGRKTLDVLTTTVIPVLKRLHAEEGLQPHRLELELVLKSLEGVASGACGEGGAAQQLSVTELRVASLIKSGLSTEQIAEMLLITPHTVRTHRRNIRKKLKISKSSHDLRGYLMKRI
jgi:DNA-binding NarL/FixJ family response regulator